MNFSKTTKLASILFVGLFLFSTTSSLAQKKKKGKSTAPAAKKDKDTPKKISEVTKKSKKIDGLFPLYQDTTTGAIKMIVSEKQIGIIKLAAVSRLLR